MSNIHAEKALALLASAEKKRDELNVRISNWEEKRHPIGSRFDLNLRQEEIKSTIAAAQVHATLASIPRPVQIGDPKTPLGAEEPLDEDQGTPFDQFLGNPLDLLEGVVNVARAFSPRTAKDSPQA